MKFRLKKRHITIFSIVVILCVLAIGEAMYLFVFKRDTKNESLSEDNVALLQEKFDTIFDNKIYINGYDTGKIIKKTEDKDVVYSSYQKNEKIENKYDINIEIPYLNIGNDIINKCNDEIKNVFQNKANNIMTSALEDNVIYNVSYVGYISYNILSLVIKSTLKEGQNPQRVIINTYNYDLNSSKILTLKEVLGNIKLEENFVQSKIMDEVKKEAKQAEELKNIGYNNIYQRDLTSQIYKIENTKNFFIGEDGILYIIYAYGNLNYTNALDLVIIR